MDRRAFLTGLFGAGVVAAMPLKVEAVIEASSEDVWREAIEKVFQRYYQDIFLFGQGAIRYDNVFPCVHNVDPFPPHKDAMVRDINGEWKKL